MTTPSSSSDSSADSSTDSSAPSPTPADTPGVILTPRPWVPLGLVLLGLASLLLLPRWSGALWLAGALVLFGLLLLLQTALLRLQFSPDALLVWRRQTLLRRFPYDEWLGWAVWWSPLPVLFISVNSAASTCCRCCLMPPPCASSSTCTSAPRNDRSVHLP